MADSQPLDSLRLTLMQDVLPVGLAFVDRVRTDGPAKAVESVAKGDDPLGDLIAGFRMLVEPGTEFVLDDARDEGGTFARGQALLRLPRKLRVLHLDRQHEIHAVPGIFG